jgi:hypothetical protein
VRPRKDGTVRRSTQPRHPLKRLGVAAFLAALSLAASASPAGASVTIGQLSPDPSTTFCFGPMDEAQPTVTSGNTYVVPPLPPASALVITSWSHNARVGAGQTFTMKVFRKVADPARYQVVGHDGPRPLAASTLNTFPASVPVKPGDVLGFNNGSPVATSCGFPVTGESYLFRNGNLADGESDPFSSFPGFRLNISAVVAPTNSFTLGKAKLNKKKGTATLTATVPNPGVLTASGNGVKAASAGRAVTSKSVGAGQAQLLIKATGKKKRKLNETGKVKLNVAITYTPTGGDPSTQSVKVKLKKKL